MGTTDHYATAAAEAHKRAVAIVAHPATLAVLGYHADRLRRLVPVDLVPDAMAATYLALDAALRHRGHTISHGQPIPRQYPAAGDTEAWVALRATLPKHLKPIFDDLTAADVPVAPDHPLDVAVVVQLALIDLDWTAPPDAIVAGLNLPPTFTVNAAGSAIEHVRPGTGRRVDAAAAGIRREVEWLVNPLSRRLRATAADGGRTTAVAGRDRVQRRREALAELLASDPRLAAHSDSAIAKRLRETWGKPDKPGGRLAAAIGGARPSDRTLRDDLAAVAKKAGNAPGTP
jgi:hypothetical protein